MSAGHRIADVIRVVDELGPLSADRLRVVAALLPQIDSPQPAATPRRRAPAAGPAAGAGGPGAAAGTTGEPAVRARARLRALAWARRRRIGLSAGLLMWLVTGLELRQRRRVGVAVVLVGVVVAAWAFGGLAVWVAIAVGVALVATAAVLVARALLAWRRSPAFDCQAEQEADTSVGELVPARAGELVLDKTAWTAPPAADPLVAVGRQRSLAIGIAAAPVDGELDLRRVVEDIACRRRTRRPPRQVTRSLRGGVQLLVDRGPALDPFRGDVALLTHALSRVLAPGALELLWFSADPWLVFAPRRRGQPVPPARSYRDVPAPAGSTVVVLSDLGIAIPRSGPLPALPVAWREHHRAVRAAGCRALYLVPYPRERWPAGLAAQLPIVYWRDGLRVDQVTGLRRAP